MGIKFCKEKFTEIKFFKNSGTFSCENGLTTSGILTREKDFSGGLGTTSNVRRISEILFALIHKPLREVNPRIGLR